MRQIAEAASVSKALLYHYFPNAETWAKLMQSATALPEAHGLIDDFRAATLASILAGLTGTGGVRPALRTAVQGWLGYMDMAILDWVHNRDLTRE